MNFSFSSSFVQIGKDDEVLSRLRCFQKKVMGPALGWLLGSRRSKSLDEGQFHAL